MANRWSSSRTEGSLGSAWQPGWEAVLLVDPLVEEEERMGLTHTGYTLLSLALRVHTEGKTNPSKDIRGSPRW